MDTNNGAELQKTVNKNMLYCQKCGTKYSRFFRKCPNCGAKHAQPFYNRWWFWILAIFFFLFMYAQTIPNNQGATESAIPTAQPVISAEEYKASCGSVSYIDLSRNPNNYVGQNAVFTGQVVQVQENGNAVTLRINVTKDKYGMWDDTCYIDYQRKDSNESRILENDIVTVYGTIKGIKSYTAVLGNQISIPHIVAEYIDIQQ